ncbi:hypothetical protein [Streptomyces sp. NPDC012746]|uniref:hypothetical protein n=1 Tax=Streptomyces sp. NPDC012746 TaxID=3364845 RepID=UPI0036A77AB8
MTSTPALVEAVTIFSLVAAGLCLILGTVIGCLEHGKGNKTVEKAVEAKAGEAARPPGTPVREQAGVNFADLGKLAEAMAKLRLSAQLLIVALGFTAVAAAAAGIGSIATAIA